MEPSAIINLNAVRHDHDHGGNSTAPESVNTAALNGVRIMSIFLIFIIAMAAGLFVIRYGGKHRITGSGRWYHMLLRYATPFTGGLFLALAVIHVFPEANEAMDAAYGEDVNDQYRLGPLMATFAFVLLTFIEKFFGAPSDDVAVDDLGSPLASPAHAQGENDSRMLPGESKALRAAHIDYTSDNTGHVQVSDSEQANTNTEKKDVRTPRTSLLDAEPHSSASRDVDRLQRSGKVEDALVRTALAVNSADDAVSARSRSIRAVVLTVALAVHSVAEGIALGLASDVSDAVVFFVAIFIHKWGGSLAIGNSFALSPLSSRECTIAIVLFSLATPLGIGLGWAAQEFLPDTVNAFLEAFTVGTFIYLAMEVYVEEFGVATKNVGRKFFAYILGIALIYGATAIGG